VSTRPAPQGEGEAAAARHEDRIDPMGTLYVVATPIGNLKDVTLRALEVLAAVDVVACEDTRRTRKLLDRHGIDARARSFHKFNEWRRTEEILRLLDEGGSVALVSDAGTPAISDPGAELAARAAAAGHAVVPVPGPSAPSALLSVAGLPGNAHRFIGFLPHRQGERRRALAEAASGREILVFLEAPTRIIAALADAAALLGGDRRAAVGRELTKIHEEVVRGTLAELAAWVARRKPRGEFVIAVEGNPEPARTLPEGTIREQVHHAREKLGLDRAEAMRRVARERGIPRRDVYRALLEEE
jgi:16S rRNA (cytidine1402-2'-O)-methyltransferase